MHDLDLVDHELNMKHWAALCTVLWFLNRPVYTVLFRRGFPVAN